MNKSIALSALLLLTSLPLLAEPQAGIADLPAVQAFIKTMSRHQRFEAAALEKLFQQVTFQQKIIDAMNRPYEAKPWHAYRKLFLTDARIQGGVEFWKQHEGALAQAKARYGVDPQIVVAILGVETSYGKNTGNYRVIDALATLAFDYPKRADFFRKELESFLILCREEGMDALIPQGSYAGAMGLPQFMPSSFRSYAADLEGDGRRDIWNNPADAIASVARYFSVHGWKTGEAVAFPAKVGGEAFKRSLNRDARPTQTLEELKNLGVRIDAALPELTRAKLLELEGENSPEYWVTLNNFYVITRYNHSPLYAMAAHQLSQEVLRRRNAAH